MMLKILIGIPLFIRITILFENIEKKEIKKVLEKAIEENLALHDEKRVHTRILVKTCSDQETRKKQQCRHKIQLYTRRSILRTT